MPSSPLSPGKHSTVLNPLEIHYTVLAASPSLPAVLVHPPPCGIGAAIYFSTFAHLSSKYTIIVPSPRGNDASERPARPEEMSSRHMVADLECLRMHLGINTFHAVIGHAAGGVIALGYAITYPERVHRLILLNSDLLGYVREDDSFAHDAMALFHENPPQNDIEFRAFIIKMLPLYFAFPDLGGPEKFVEDWKTMPSLWAYQSYYAADLAFLLDGEGAQLDVGVVKWRQIDELGRVACRTLVLTGREDRATGPEVAACIAHGCRKSVLCIIEACGHMSWLERPDVVWDVVQEFLEEGA